MEVSLIKIIHEWFDGSKYKCHFMVDYASADCFIMRHAKTHRIIVVIAQNDSVAIHFLHMPVYIRAADPQLFYKMDNALNQFIELEVK